MGKSSILLFVFSLLVSAATAQPGSIEFKHYSRRDGLSSTNLNSVVQDENGFLWVSQKTGFHRFNGYEFEDFSDIISDTSYTTVFSHVANAPNSSLLIGTETSGLYRYYPEDNHLIHYNHDPDDGSSLDANFVSFTFTDSKERMWIGTWFGLSLLNPDNSFTHYPLDTDGSKSIFNYNVIEDIVELSDGTFWIGTWGGGLHHFDPYDGTFNHFEKRHPEDEQNLWVKDIEVGSDQTLYLATIGHGILQFDIKSSQFEQVDFNISQNGIGFQRILDVMLLENDVIWAASEEGLIVIDQKNHSARVINDQGSKSESLQNKLVELLFEDNHNGIWIAAGGLSYYNREAAKFDLYQHEAFTNSLSDNGVKCFLEVDSTTFWISTELGINVWNTKKNYFELLELFPESPHILKKWKNIIYAAVPRRGLYTYDLITGEKEQYLPMDNKGSGLLDNHIRGMELDNEGNLWIGSTKGLTIRRANDGRFIHIPGDQAYTNGLKGLSVSSVAITSNNELWVLNHRNILKLDYISPLLLKPDGQAGIVYDTTRYSFENKDRHSLIGAMHAKGSKVYCTVSSGLLVYNIATNNKSIIRSEAALAGDNIKSISIDHHGGVWLSTDNGLAYVNMSTKEVTNFYEEDGLQGNFFQGNAALTASNGNILVGGNNGFNVIHPEDIELNPYAPPVFVTDLQVYNASLPVKNHKNEGSTKDKAVLPRNSSYIDTLQLNYTQNSLTLELAALNFLYPEKNEFAYFMEGFDQDWNYIKNRRYISYNDLPEGKWLLLHLKAANNNGIWTPTVKNIHIFIHPPIYNTLWFRSGIAAIIILLIILVYRIRINNLKQARRRLETLVARRTHEVEHQKQEIEVKNRSLTSQSEHLQLQNQNIELFSQIGRQITSSIGIENIFLETFNQITAIIKCDHMAIGRITDRSDVLDYWEMSQGKIQEQEVSLKSLKRLSAISFYENKTIMSNDIKPEIGQYIVDPPSYYFDSPYNSVIYIPLQSETKGCIGMLVAKSERKHAFTDDHLNLLNNISTYMTIALENSNAYDQIKEQSEQLQEIDRIKTRFYTNISHEFRTPLSLIIGPADELMKNPNLSVRDKEYLEIINQNARRMLKLVAQVLDLSKLEDGVLRLEVSKGDLVESVKDIVDSFRFMAEKQNIDLDFQRSQDALVGYYDQDKIEKIIYNLLNNAFKYTNSNGAIILKLHQQPTKQFSKCIAIEVIDTGIGIPKDKLEHIFETYYRVDNEHTQKHYGAGIGLALVKKLVELHHGTIEVNSKIDEGTSFVVTIPIDAEAYVASEIYEHIANATVAGQNHGATPTLLDDQRSYAIPKIGQKKLLLVEDNEDLLQFMVNSLQADFEVHTAVNGVEATKILSLNRPDLIVSDVMMPKMDGFELCRQVKSSDEYGDIPVILLTAKNSQASQMEGLAQGADAYLPKPVKIDLLKLGIENLLASYENIRKKYESKLVLDPNNLQVKDGHDKFLKKVIQILEDNITNKSVNIDLFASELGMSRTLLYEKIKKATGQSMGIFIKTNRLNYSLKLLLENHYNTSELAYEVGFSDPKYFSKCFRRQFGKTPKEYLQSRLNSTATKVE